MGWKLKILLLVIGVLVALNIFLPDRAEEAIEMISETTGISEKKITESVDLATGIAQDSAELAKDKAVEIKDDAVDSIED